MSRAYKFINTIQVLAKNDGERSIDYETRGFHCPGAGRGEQQSHWQEVGTTHIVDFSVGSGDRAMSARFTKDGCFFWKNGGFCGVTEAGLRCDRNDATSEEDAARLTSSALEAGLKLVNKKSR